MNSFETEYKRLNKAQKEAVEAIDGPVMVIAGPGTGKTQILSLRIANILKKTDTAPENILALTFTESGVASMRKRLSSIIGSAAYSVVINTFHGFANDVIKNNPEDFPRIIGSKNITEIDQVSILEEIILDEKLDLLKPFGDTFYYVKSILKAINDLKREGISPEEFTDITDKAFKDFEKIEDLYYDKGAYKGKMKGKYKDLEKQIKKNKELADIYEAYEKKLVKQKKYDYNDMIMEVLRELRSNEDLLLRLQEEHQYILVDEHQDTNNAQNKILELLANFHPNPNLFVVGDEKQSIFKFQGASLENFYYFKNLYPEAKLVTLEENYRSTQKILDSAHSLIPSPKSLKANNASEEKNICFRSFKDELSERYFIAEDIQEKIKDGVTPSEIAILYRNNNDAFPVADMLTRFGISYVIESDQDILNDKYIKKFITILRGVADFGNDEILAEMLHVDLFNINPLDLFKIIRSANDKRNYSLFDMVANTDKILDKIVLENKNAIVSVYKKISDWRVAAKNEDLVSVLEKILRESGLLTLIMSSGAEKLDTMNRFFDEARAILSVNLNAKLKDLFDYLDTIKKHEMSIKRHVGARDSNRVRLMTVHRSKGLEFEYVYIVGAYDGHFGNKNKRELIKLLPEVYALQKSKKENNFDYLEKDTDSEERRLFYVAITRAKKQVTVTYSEFGEDGRERVPSQFLSEIDKSLIDVAVDSEGDEKARKEVLFKDKDLRITKEEYKNRYKEFIREKFLSQGLSVSALNNYLKSPWLYFYRNLVRIPAAQTKHQIYGTAIHSVLEKFFTGLKEGEKLGKNFLIESFEEELEKQSLSKHDKEELLDKGHDSLEAWFKSNEGSFQTHVLTEFRINGVYLSEEVRLTGVLDKLEFIDGSDRHVRVVDYKTGAPKTLGFVKGETKDSDGDYYRQIVFYKLLLKLYADGKYIMDEGKLEFVEPDEKGKLVNYIFSPTDEEVKNLEEEIKRVSDEIMNLKFWDEVCDPQKCEYCDLVEEIKKNI